MNIPRSKHYYKPKKDKHKDLNILDKIAGIALDFPCYGYRRITAHLRREGTAINHKKVYRIMAQNGICCSIRRSYKHTTNSNHNLAKYPNLIEDLVTCKAKSSLACRYYLHKICSIICIPCSNNRRV